MLPAKGKITGETSRELGRSAPRLRVIHSALRWAAGPRLKVLLHVLGVC